MLGRWFAKLRHSASSPQYEAYAAVGFAVIATAGVSAYAAPQHAERLRASLRGTWESVAAETATAARSAQEHVQTALRKVPEAVYSLGSNESRVAVSIAKSIADRSSDPKSRELLIHFGGSTLLRWLVNHACDDPTALQAECERALAQLLLDEEAAPAVLRHRGVVPALLEHIASGKASEDLAEALHSAAARPSLSYLVSPRDVRSTLSMAQGRHGAGVQHLAAALLGAWARASPVNRRKLAACGAYSTLADVAVAACHQQGPAARDLLRSLIETLNQVAGSEVAWEGAHLACWVQPALYVAADAAVAGDTALAQRALAAMRHLVVHGGEEVQQQLQRSPLLPLLHRLADGGTLREEVGQIVAALTASGLLAVEAVPDWRDRLLLWILQPAAGESARRACIDALEALSAPSAAAGPSHVAYYWLAAILDHLAATPLAARALNDSLAEAPAAGAPPLPAPPPQATSWQESVLVQPAYARWVAADLRLAVASPESAATAGQAATPPPAPLLELLGPEASAAYPAAARVVDAALAQQKLGTALEVLNRMVADDPSRQAALLEAGIIPLLSRLCLDQPPPASQPRAPQRAPEPAQPSRPPPQQQQAASSPAPQPAPADAPPGDLPVPDAAAAPDATAASGQPGRFQWLLSRLRPTSPTLTSDPTVRFAPAAGEGTDDDAVHPGGGAPHSPPAGQQLQPGEGAGHLWRAEDGGGGDAGLGADNEAASMQAAALLAAKQLEQEEAVEHPPAPLAIQRQAARLLALLCVQAASHSEARQQLEASAWLPWLEQAARSPDCSLSSSSTRALLHLAAAAPPHAGPAPAEDPARQDLQAHVVCLDGVHLVSPDACHHWTLATGEEVARRQQGALAGFLADLLMGPCDEADEAGDAADGGSAAAAAATGKLLQRAARRCSGSAGEPLLDVVFVHGIRGGPFVTWRKREVGVGRGPAGRSSMRRDACWPSDWLAPEVPQARLLSVEYVAPVSFWEGESVPLVETARQVSQKLLAAGVGRRPVVFVGHSMGGLIVKEILAQALAELDPSCAPPPPPLQPPPQPQRPAAGGAAGAARGAPDAVQGRRWWQGWWWSTGSGMGGGAAAGGAAPMAAVDSGALPPAVAAATPAAPSAAAPSDGGGSLPGNNASSSTSSSSSSSSSSSGSSDGSRGSSQDTTDSGSSNRQDTQPSSSSSRDDSGGGGGSAGQAPTLAALLGSTRAVVFYSTPHFGSSLAAYGWKLRYIGGAPAPSIAYLSPGPHLEHINDCLRRLHQSRDLQVLSVCEGLPTQLAGFMPQVHIVPPHSSNPGFGEVAMVQEDHIACCKPSSKDDPIFALLLKCLRSVIADLDT